VDIESRFRPVQVASRVATTWIPIDDAMCEFELRTLGVHPDAEEPSRCDTRLSESHMLVSAPFVAVLENLNADNNGKSSAGRKRVDRSVNQPISSVRQAGRHLLDRHFRDVDSDQIQTTRYEGHVIATIAATDIKSDGTEQMLSAGGLKDLIDERQRRFAVVAAGAVLNIPGLSLWAVNAIRRPTHGSPIQSVIRILV